MAGSMSFLTPQVKTCWQEVGLKPQTRWFQPFLLPFDLVEGFIKYSLDVISHTVRNLGARILRRLPRFARNDRFV
jgi:hypothetical protein